MIRNNDSFFFGSTYVCTSVPVAFVYLIWIHINYPKYCKNKIATKDKIFKEIRMTAAVFFIQKNDKEVLNRVTNRKNTKFTEMLYSLLGMFNLIHVDTTIL